jgi:hypothetical protein
VIAGHEHLIEALRRGRGEDGGERVVAAVEVR